MIKNLFAFIVALMSMSISWAVGPFDGIYKHPTIENRYASVHQTGSRMIIATFDTSTSVLPNVTVNSSIGPFKPTRLDFWELTAAAMSGVNTIRIAGETVFGACKQTFDLVFDQSSMTVTNVAAEQTSTGSAQSIPCAGLVQPGSPSIVYPKVL